MKRDSGITISLYNGIGEFDAFTCAAHMISRFTGNEEAHEKRVTFTWEPDGEITHLGTIERKKSGNLAVTVGLYRP